MAQPDPLSSLTLMSFLYPSSGLAVVWAPAIKGNAKIIPSAIPSTTRAHELASGALPCSDPVIATPLAIIQRDECRRLFSTRQDERQRLHMRRKARNLDQRLALQHPTGQGTFSCRVFPIRHGGLRLHEKTLTALLRTLPVTAIGVKNVLSNRPCVVASEHAFS
jgi:hypothetical protein